MDHRLDIKSIDPTSLSEPELTLLKTLTPIENHDYLYKKNPLHIEDLNYFFLVAYKNKKPIALLIGTTTATHYIAEIHSLFVTKEERHKNIGFSLLEKFEETVKELGSILILMHFSSEIEGKEDLEHLISLRNWKKPLPEIQRYFFDGKTFNPNWILPDYSYGDQIHRSMFHEITENEKAMIKRWEEEGRFPSEVSPFINEENIEPINSFLLKKENNIIGWIITHRLNESTIRYSALYVETEYRFTGIAIKLLIDAMKTQKQAIENHHLALIAVFDLNTHQTSSIWQQFVNKRLKPYAIKTLTIYQTWKDLKKE